MRNVSRRLMRMMGFRERIEDVIYGLLRKDPKLTVFIDIGGYDGL